MEQEPELTFQFEVADLEGLSEAKQTPAPTQFPPVKMPRMGELSEYYDWSFNEDGQLHSSVVCKGCGQQVSGRKERMQRHLENCTSQQTHVGLEFEPNDNVTGGQNKQRSAHSASDSSPLTSYPVGKPGRRRDEIWHFYTEVNNMNKKVVKCNQCSKLVSGKVERLRAHYALCNAQNSREIPKPGQRSEIWKFFTEEWIDNKLVMKCNGCLRYVNSEEKLLLVHHKQCFTRLFALSQELQICYPEDIQVMDVARLNDSEHDIGERSTSQVDTEPQTVTAGTPKLELLVQYSDLATSFEGCEFESPAVDNLSDITVDQLKEDISVETAPSRTSLCQTSNSRKRKMADSTHSLNSAEESENLNDNSSSDVQKAYNYCDMLNQTLVDNLVKQWLVEDIPSYDIAGFVVGSSIDQAAIYCKSEGVLCGQPFVASVFNEVQCEVTWEAAEGAMLRHGQIIARVRGPRNKILQGERLALNIITRASGIATVARNYWDIRKKYNWDGEVAATRKTTPGFRQVEKYAVMVGGCSPHRNDLSAMIMLKDNHIWAAGDVTEAVKKCREACGFSTKIEVECRSYQEAKQAMTAGADIVMLDNFTSIAAEDTAKELKKLKPTIIIEVSGGINETNIGSYMVNSVDVISTSSLTQGYRTLDFSCKIIRENRNPLNPTVTA